ncbi:MAG: efflux RND transporter periplasmic adaptor subunit [Spirochaetes bacterium]|nr:efflux RND transporter periplasmic adaptor subunit [Spirochaetota bacterium]
MNRRRFVYVVIISFMIIITVAVLRSCQINSKKTNEPENEIKEIPVKAADAKITDLKQTVKLTGNIIGTEVIQIFPSVTGKIKTILVKQGDPVRANQTLFQIDRDVIGMEFRLASVQSPINGYVASIYANRGMSVAPATPLAEIVNQKNVECVVQIMEEDINTIASGSEAEITVNSFPDRIFKGIVYKKSPVLNQISRTQEIRISIENSSLELRHGMFADVEIITKLLRNVLIVPVDSLFYDKDDVLSVFIVRNKKAVKTPVSISVEIGNYAVVESGLSAGDTIITLGHENVNEGDQLLVYKEEF